MKKTVKLKRPLPPDRTLEQVENHYKAEKALAEVLKQVDRNKRKKLYPVMYDKLFKQEPDHPRFQRRQKNKRLTLESNRSKFNIVKNFIMLVLYLTYLEKILDLSFSKYYKISTSRYLMPFIYMLQRIMSFH